MGAGGAPAVMPPSPEAASRQRRARAGSPVADLDEDGWHSWSSGSGGKDVTVALLPGGEDAPLLLRQREELLEPELSSSLRVWAMDVLLGYERSCSSVRQSQMLALVDDHVD